MGADGWENQYWYDDNEWSSNAAPQQSGSWSSNATPQYSRFWSSNATPQYSRFWYSNATPQYSRFWYSNATPQYSGSWADGNEFNSGTSNFWDYDDEFYSFDQFRNYRPRSNSTPVYTRIDEDGNIRYYVFDNDYYGGNDFYDSNYFYYV